MSVVNIYCSCDGSRVVEGKYREERDVRVKPSRDIICRLTKECEGTGSVCVCDGRAEGRNLSVSVSTERLAVTPTGGQ